MLEKDKWISIGEIVAPQGLRGDIRIKPCSDFPERFTKPGKRWIQKNNELPTEIQLKKGKLIPGKSIYVLSIEGVSNRSDAEARAVLVEDISAVVRNGCGSRR